MTDEVQVLEVLREFRDAIKHGSNVKEKLANVVHMCQKNATCQELMGIQGACDELKLLLEEYISSKSDSQLLDLNEVINGITCLCRRNKDKSSTSEYNQTKFGDCGIVQQLMKAASLFILSSELCIVLCNCIMCLSSDHHYNQQLFIKSGAYQILVDIIKHHDSNSDVIENCCKALRNLTSDQKLISAELEDSGLTELLTSFISPPLIYTESCTISVLWCLVNVSCRSKISIQLFDHGGYQQLIRFLDLHTNNVLILIPGYWALRNITYENICREEFLSFSHTDTCAQLLRCIDLYWENEEVIESVLWYILNLSCSRTLADLLISCGIIAVISGFLQPVHPNETVAEAAFGIIRNVFCTLDELGGTSTTTEHLEAIICSLANVTHFHMESPSITICFCDLLSRLATAKRHIQDMCIDAGIIDLLVQLTNTHLEHYEALEAALRAVFSVVGNDHDKNRNHFLQQHICELIIYIMFLYQFRSSMVHLCCELILILYFPNIDQQTYLRENGAINTKGEVEFIENFSDVIRLWEPQNILRALFWERRKQFWLFLYGCSLLEGTKRVKDPNFQKCLTKDGKILQATMRVFYSRDICLKISSFF